MTRIGPRLARAAVATVAATWLCAGPLTSSAGAAPSRYSLANGCHALRAPAGGFAAEGGGGYTTAAALSGAEPFRMRATALGRYLLYGSDRDFLAANALERVVPATAPSNSSVWIVRGARGVFTLYNRGARKSLAVSGGELVLSETPGRFTFAPTTGCPRYPEVAINAVGPPTRGPVSYGEVSGLVDAHMHHMAFEFLGGRVHCGKPFHRFGAPYALVDCEDHEPNGCAAVLENALFGEPARCHDPVGWPTFVDWPHHKSLTHEQSYYKWLERSWRGGQRIFVNLLVENEVLCELYPLKKNSCDEMDSARLQVSRMRGLQNYIDAQNGGPGRGWYRIVRNPFEARRVINQGKLAVIMGMEVSKPFGCGRFNGMPTCDEQQINDQLDEFHRLGVRQMEVINKFDNAFSGVAGDGGEIGAVVNLGNFYDTGRFWDLETCHDHRYHDHTPSSVQVHNDDALIANGLSEFLPPGSAPVYPAPPHCNTIGLEPLAKHALRRIIAKRMIFDPDHMGVYARQQALDLVERHDYPGVVSSHSWSTDDAYPRIYALGGFIAPYAGSSQGFVGEWQRMRTYRTGRQYFGFGYGADMNGFGSQGGPRGAGVSNPVTYPFRSFDGKVELSKQHSGQRVYDINTDGVAHYGLYPDWIQDLRKLAGPQILRDMGRGAEAYLQMWERAEGVTPVRCRVWRGDFGAGGLEAAHLGDSPKPLLLRAGQPVKRTDSWRWCARNSTGAAPRDHGVRAVFTDSDRVGLILSQMPGHSAGGIAPGDSAGQLAGSATNLGAGLWTAPSGSGTSRFVYVVRDGVVRFTGVAATSVASSAAVLRAHVARATG